MWWIIVPHNKVLAVRSRITSCIQTELDGKAECTPQRNSLFPACIHLSAFPCTIAPHHQLKTITELVLEIEKWSTQGINEVSSPSWVFRARHDVGPWNNLGAWRAAWSNMENIISIARIISIASWSNSSFFAATGTLFHCSAMGRKA